MPTEVYIYIVVSEKIYIYIYICQGSGDSIIINMSIQCALSSPTAHSIEEDGWSNSIDETITFIGKL